MCCMAEQLTLNQWVLGSSPRWCTKKSLTENVGLFFIAITRNVELVHHRRTRTARARRPLRRANRVRWRGRAPGEREERQSVAGAEMFPLCGLTRCVGLFFYCNNPGRRPVRASQPVKAHCFAYPRAKKEEIPWKKARQRFSAAPGVGDRRTAAGRRHRTANDGQRADAENAGTAGSGGWGNRRFPKG